MSTIAIVNKQRALEVEGEIYTKEMIKKNMDAEQLHMLCAFCEKEGHLRFIQENTDIESVQIYIDNLLMNHVW